MMVAIDISIKINGENSSECIRLFERTGKLLNKYGDEHPDVVDAYRMVGNASMALGQKEEALDSFNKALDILQRHLSEEHVDIVELKQTIKEISKNQ